ncbi:MAG: energy transducer TonB [Sphingobacteriales bacterium]|nr:MAG: energy transducer TonB [Sphingobacteriales bacterium]
MKMMAMMNNSTMYSTGWLDIVFKKRNQSYGAYALRAQSDSILTRSLMISAPLFVALILAPLIYNKVFPELKMTPVNLTSPDDLSVKIYDLPKPKELPKPAPAAHIEKVKTVAFAGTPMVRQLPIEPLVPSLVDIKDAVIGTVDQDGVIATGNQAPVSTGNGTGVANVPEQDPNAILNAATVEVYPEFEGGMAGWAKYIKKNLRYPAMAQESGVQGKVHVSFIVERDGSITDVQILRGIGGGCDEEALRVIKKSPKWKAGMQNNSAVRVRYNMPIQFTLN